jgi:hypothetical protein
VILTVSYIQVRRSLAGQFSHLARKNLSGNSARIFPERKSVWRFSQTKFLARTFQSVSLQRSPTLWTREDSAIFAGSSPSRLWNSDSSFFWFGNGRSVDIPRDYWLSFRIFAPTCTKSHWLREPLLNLLLPLSRIIKWDPKKKLPLPSSHFSRSTASSTGIWPRRNNLRRLSYQPISFDYWSRCLWLYPWPYHLTTRSNLRSTSSHHIP